MGNLSFIWAIFWTILSLAYFSPLVFSQANSGTTSGESKDILPRETWIPFKPYGNLMLVQGWINGESTSLLFDTGASGCLFSTAHLKALGIKLPTGQPTGTLCGVGVNKAMPAWLIHANLRVGSIERYNFPVQVNENPLAYPLLGVNFFQGLEYTIDSQAQVIQFKRVGDQNIKSSASPLPLAVKKPVDLNSKMTITVDAGSHYVYSLPFIEERGGIIVLAKIDGKECRMLLDTGTDTCLFTYAQIKQLGLKPRFTGQVLNARGATGLMKAPLYVFEQGEFGPIRGPLVTLVTDQASLPKPLLGQNFLKGWQLTIDHNQHLVKIIRK